MTVLLYTMITGYVLAIAIMYMIKESWMPKGNSPDEIVTQKGLFRKVYIIGGAVAIAIAFVITLVVE